MRQKIYRDRPTANVADFCKRQKEVFGATKCEATDKGDGKSDILVQFPDREL